MIKIKDTKNMVGITIHGDFEDLNALYDALSDYLRFYFDHQDAEGAYYCYECILGLCYDIRHAYQGDRNIESVPNNHENVAQLASCIYQVDTISIQKERNNYQNGNLYFNVEVMYPWAIYYLFALQSIAEDVYRHEWFEEDEFHYTEYQAERDLALIQYFVQLLWGKLQENLPEDVMHILWDYTRLYNHVEYYFDYSELYLQWLCTYWIKAAKNREERKALLPLLCLELSAILDEDEDELKDTIEEANMDRPEKSSPNFSEPSTSNKNALAPSEDIDSYDGINIRKNENNSSEVSTADEIAEFERKVRGVQASIAQTTLRGLELYDQYFDTYCDNAIPYQCVDSFTDIIYSYVRKHGPFSEESFDKWLDEELGEVYWDGLEW